MFRKLPAVISINSINLIKSVKSITLIMLITLILSSILLNSITAVTASPFKEHILTDGVSIIEAEDFDAGGAGDYYEADAEEGEHQYRLGAYPQTEAAVNDKRTDTPNDAANYVNYNVSWINPSEYLQYTVTAEKDGYYQFQAWLSSGSDAPGGVELYYNGNLIGYNEPPETGSWETYNLYDIGSYNMTAGTHIIKAEFPYGNCNIDAIVITRLGEVIATEAPAESGENDLTGILSGDSDNTDAENESAGGESGELSEENNIILYIIIAAAAVIVIVVIIVLVTKKR